MTYRQACNKSPKHHRTHKHRFEIVCLLLAIQSTSPSDNHICHFLLPVVKECKLVPTGYGIQFDIRTTRTATARGIVAQLFLDIMHDISPVVLKQSI